MAYPFEDSAATFSDLIKPLSDLAYTTTPFDPQFASRLPSGKAYHFDKIKERVCTYRSICLGSTDAFLIGERDAKTWYYFVEFKNQKVDNIQSNKDDRNKLMQKAFDSLLILALTFGRTEPMLELQRRSSFIVVYPDQEYSSRLLEQLSECANGEPLWKLDRLIQNGFYAEVKTMRDSEFSQMTLPYLP